MTTAFDWIEISESRLVFNYCFFAIAFILFAIAIGFMIHLMLSRENKKETEKPERL